MRSIPWLIWKNRLSKLWWSKKMAQKASFVAISESGETFPDHIWCDFAKWFDISEIMKMVKQKIDEDPKWETLYTTLWWENRSILHFCNTRKRNLSENERSATTYSARIKYLQQYIEQWDYDTAMQIALERKKETCQYSDSLAWKHE